MNLIGNVRAMVALGCCIGVSGALAGDIVLFESPNFQGYSVTYNGDVENLGGTGFNDRTSSISVRQGLWEVCVDAYYEGGCLQLAPGLYPQLNPPFNRSISSLREVGGGDYAPPVIPAPPAPPYIELFDREYFQGSVMVFQNAADNLGNTGFNDQTASISVRSGTWEVCYDAYYQGGCMQLPPGDYPRLDPPFVRSISSLRPVGDGGWTQAGGNAVVDMSSGPAYGTSVSISGASIGVTVASYPELVSVPGYPVYYAPGLNANYFFYDGLFWVYQRDNWYSSTWYNGPWAIVAPNVVPLYILRVPVSYYRRPPPYFYGWRGDAPPRWGDHWGPSWAQTRYGWDRWDRHAVPPPAPLPIYQRPFAGDRYPRPDQQQTLLRDNYRYQPKDGYAQQQFHRPSQPGPGVQPPRPTGQPSTPPGGPSTQPPRPTGQPSTPPGGPSTQPPRPTGQPSTPPGGPSTQPPRPTGQPSTPPGGPSTQPTRPPGQPGQPGQPPSTQPPRQPGQPGQPPSQTMQPGASPSQAPQQPARQPRPSSPPAGTQQFAPSGGMPQSPGLPQQGGGGRPPSAQPAPQGGPPPAPQSAPTQRPQGQQPSGQAPQQSGGGRRGPSDGQGQGQGQSQGGDGGGGPQPRGGR